MGCHPPFWGISPTWGPNPCLLYCRQILYCLSQQGSPFVQYVTSYSFRHGSGKEKEALTSSDLSDTTEESEAFQFIADILPKKILASKYLKMLKEKREEEEEEENDNNDESEVDEAEF